MDQRYAELHRLMAVVKRAEDDSERANEAVRIASDARAASWNAHQRAQEEYLKELQLLFDTVLDDGTP